MLDVRRLLESAASVVLVAESEEAALDEGDETSAASVAMLVAVSEHCNVCRVRLRSGQGGMSCATCGLLVHKKCCGLSHWARERSVLFHCDGCQWIETLINVMLRVWCHLLLKLCLLVSVMYVDG